jgi:two-component system response regulator QseB
VATLSGEVLSLAARELKVLTLLMQRKGHIVTKSEIEEELYGWEESIESNTVEASISKLRKHLGKDRIVTMRNIGYMMRE